MSTETNDVSEYEPHLILEGPREFWNGIFSGD